MMRKRGTRRKGRDKGEGMGGVKARGKETTKRRD